MQKKRWTIVDGVSLAQAYQVTKAGYNSYYLNDTFIFDDSVSTDPTEIEGNTGSNDWLRSKNGTINSSGRCCNLSRQLSTRLALVVDKLFDGPSKERNCQKKGATLRARGRRVTSSRSGWMNGNSCAGCRSNSCCVPFVLRRSIDFVTQRMDEELQLMIHNWLRSLMSRPAYPTKWLRIDIAPTFIY